MVPINLFLVNWIHVITILQVQSSAITIRLFRNMPLLFLLYLARTIFYATGDVGPPTDCILRVEPITWLWLN